MSVFVLRHHRSLASALVLCGAGACSIAPLPLARSRPIKGSRQEGTHRIECHYEMANCDREARKTCSGRYDVVSRGSHICADCGLSLDSSAGSPVYVGTLYVRCHEEP